MAHPIWLALALAALSAAPALSQDADQVAAGEKVFRRCGACHQVGPDAENRVGPVLTGVIGRSAGSLEGFKFSKPMVEAGQNGLVWNDETLLAYLADPRALVKGTKMAFAGLKSEDDRRAVIAYIEANGGAM